MMTKARGHKHAAAYNIENNLPKMQKAAKKQLFTVRQPIVL